MNKLSEFLSALPSAAKWLGAAMVGVAVVFSVLWVVSNGSSNEAVAGYDRNLRDWQGSTASALAASGTTLPEGLYRGENYASARGLAVQRRDCAALDASVKELSEQNDFSPPKLQSRRLGFMSGQYRQTRQRALSLDKAVNSFVNQSREEFGQFAADCRYMLKLSQADAKVRKSVDRIDASGLAKGESFVNGKRVFICREAKTCAPTGADFRRFAAAFTSSVELKQQRADINKSEDCTASVMGASMCAAAEAGWAAALQAERAYVRELVKSGGRLSDDRMNKLVTLHQKMNGEYDEQGKSFGQKAIKKWPFLADDDTYPPADVSEYYTVFLVTSHKVGELKKAAAKFSPSAE